MLECDDIDMAKETAWHIVREVEASNLRVENTDKTISVTISAGMAELDAHNDYNVSVHRADEALYKAKRDGKNRVCVWNDGKANSS